MIDVVMEFYEIVTQIGKKAIRLLEKDVEDLEFEPKVPRISKLLYLFPEWLNKLYNGKLLRSQGRMINDKEN
jgi:hypothetical protein